MRRSTNDDGRLLKAGRMLPLTVWIAISFGCGPQQAPNSHRYTYLSLGGSSDSCAEIGDLAFHFENGTGAEEIVGKLTSTPILTPDILDFLKSRTKFSALQLDSLRKVMNGSAEDVDYLFYYDTLKPMRNEVSAFIKTLPVPPRPLEPPTLTSLVQSELDRFFVRQTDPDMCWAASLESAFRSGGFDYDQNQFVTALQNACRFKASKRANILQIMYAADQVRTGDGVWPVAFGAVVPWVMWHSEKSQGGLFLIDNADDLIRRFSDGAVIVVGLAEASTGHVSLIRRLTYEGVGGNPTRITEIEVMDPAGDPNFKSYQADYLLDTARFLLAVYPK